MSKIISKDDIKIHLFGTAQGTKYDTIFNQLANQIDAMFQDLLRIKHSEDGGEAIADEVIDGTGCSTLLVKYKPIVAVTKIEYLEADYSWTEWTQVAAGSLDFEDNKIFTQNYVVAGKGNRNVRVNYTCGYSDANIPEDLKLAAVLVAVGLFNQRNQVGFKSQNVLGVSVQLDDMEYRQTKQIMDRYKNAKVY